MRTYPEAKKQILHISWVSGVLTSQWLIHRHFSKWYPYGKKVKGFTVMSPIKSTIVFHVFSIFSKVISLVIRIQMTILQVTQTFRLQSFLLLLLMCPVEIKPLISISYAFLSWILFFFSYANTQKSAWIIFSILSCVNTYSWCLHC